MMNLYSVTLFGVYPMQCATVTDSYQRATSLCATIERKIPGLAGLVFVEPVESFYPPHLVDADRAILDAIKESEMKYTYEKRAMAHLHFIPDTDPDGEERTILVTVPDQVAEDQRAFDGESFPALEGDTVTLCGEEYDLRGPGTGDMVVRLSLD